MGKLKLIVPSISEEEARRAFERSRPAFDALEEGQLVRISLDIARAVGIVLVAESRVRSIVDEIRRQIPSFEVRYVETLRDVALAAWHVHATVPPPAMRSVPKKTFDEAVRLRRALLGQVRALDVLGLLGGAPVPAVAGRRNADLGEELLLLAELFRSSWDAIGGKTPVTREQIERAIALGEELKAAFRCPDGDPSTLRLRAFSLLARNYDQVRRAVTYVRWNADDRDEFAPSIYTGSRGGRRNGSE